jgi:hypothetical protein
MAKSKGTQVLVTVIVHEIEPGKPTKLARIDQKGQCPKKTLRFATGRALNSLKRQ